MKKIIAVDFDGILCEDKFPEIGKPNYEVISFVREMIDRGHEVILWTSRADGRLVEATQWCEDRGLHFCAVNDNAPSNKEKYEELHPNGTRKVYADFYLDDKSVEFARRSIYGYKQWNGVQGAIRGLLDDARKVMNYYDD